MNTIEITISNIHERGFAFGVSEQSAEQCFIPPHVLDGSGARRGDTVTVQVVTNPNEKQRENTRWCAINIVRGGDTERKGNEVMERKIYDFMCTTGYTYAGEIAQHLKITPAAAEEYALILFNQGAIAKADVYANCDKKEPSFTLWAEDASLFLEGSE